MKSNLSRRNVVKGTAWAIPVVAASTALPSVAASQSCNYVSPAWQGNGFIASGLTARREVIGKTIITHGDAYASNSDGDLISTRNLSEISDRYSWVPNLIVIAQNGDDTSGSYLHVDFPQAAHCVQFFLHDIDSQGAGKRDHYRDSVTVTANGSPIMASPLHPENLRVTGNGSDRVTIESPFEHGVLDSKYEWDMKRSTKGTALVTIKGPINGFSILYQNADTLSDDKYNYQQIAMSPVRWSTTPCDCN
ncbi:hypothetical protein FYJ43_02070 [Cutibacterium sp. WCA-380-WT-3A]|uniref:Uncharacterized protein n=1 Tax=Cutibacterium porci TaxID=2605781 RepID=A0A7K0J4L8_9ACTN|nr:hypothetical protein [Cutibacterium porci]MSS44862.1 hypothetical protein [Cutibacterium porci]